MYSSRQKKFLWLLTKIKKNIKHQTVFVKQFYFSAFCNVFNTSYYHPYYSRNLSIFFLFPDTPISLSFACHAIGINSLFLLFLFLRCLSLFISVMPSNKLIKTCIINYNKRFRCNRPIKDIF